MNLKSISQLAKRSESRLEKTEATIRSEIQNAESNGLAESGAIIRIGRRIFIDEDRYWAWFESRGAQNERRPSAAQGAA